MRAATPVTEPLHDKETREFAAAFIIISLVDRSNPAAVLSLA